MPLIKIQMNFSWWPLTSYNEPADLVLQQWHWRLVSVCCFATSFRSYFFDWVDQFFHCSSTSCWKLRFYNHGTTYTYMIYVYENFGFTRQNKSLFYTPKNIELHLENIYKKKKSWNRLNLPVTNMIKKTLIPIFMLLWYEEPIIVRQFVTPDRNSAYPC